MVDPRRRILVVENEADLHDIIEAFLEELDVDLVFASDGEEALALLAERGPPDLILLDFMMPGIDGFEFRARQLKDPELRHVPVVFMTAIREIPAQRDEGREIVCLKKPFDQQELVAVVTQCLARPRRSSLPPVP
jgi:CheY-like chemotaxis protein